MSFFWGEISNKSVSWVPFRLDCVAFRNFGYRFLEQQLPLQKNPSNQPWHLFPKTFLPTSPLPYHGNPPGLPSATCISSRVRSMKASTSSGDNSAWRWLWAKKSWKPPLASAMLVEFCWREIFLFFGANEKVLTLIVGCFLFFFRKGKKRIFQLSLQLSLPIFLRGQVIKWLFF